MGINMEVIPKKNEDPIRVIKKFIKKCKKEGFLREVMDRKHYKKPSVAKKEKRIRAERMRLKEERKRRKAQERRNRKL